MAVKYTNNYSSTLNGAISDVATTITVASATGLPTVGGGDYCYVTLDTGGGSPTREIVKVTAISSNDLTVVRAQDGTSASAFSSGAVVELRIAAALLTDIKDEASQSNEHIQDVVGGMIGTTTNISVTYDDAGDQIDYAVNALPTSATTSGTFADGRISESSVTQHQAALSVTEAQVAVSTNDIILGRTTAGSGGAEELSAATVRTLINVEDGSTADQSDSEIETAYNNQVAVASQVEAEAGTITDVKRFTPERIKQAIDALSPADLSVTSAKLATAIDVTTSLGVGGGSTNGVSLSQGAIAVKNGGSVSYIDLYCENANAHYARIQSPVHAAYSGNVELTLPAQTGNLIGTDANDVTSFNGAVHEQSTSSTTASTTHAIDLNDGGLFEVTLAHNITTFTWNNIASSGTAHSFTLIMKQDGSGGHSIAWPANVRWAAGTAPTPSSGANEVDAWTFVTNDQGSNWYGFAAALALA